MAPKVCVPADFGRHHIGAPSHGNLTFNLGEGVQIKANSIILSLNSPIIDDLTTNLHLTSLEAEDFSREAVDCFIEASYTGEIEAVTVGNFRDVNKMSRVFDISWLVARCEEYFVSYLDKLDSESSNPDILFAVEEAVYLLSTVKKRDFLNLVVKKMCCISVTRRDSFMKEYLNDFINSSKFKIDASIAIVKTDVHVLIEIVILHLEQQGNLSLDDNTRYLLKSVNLAICHQKSPDLHTKLYSVLANLQSVGKEDFQLLLEITKQLTSKPLPQTSQLVTIFQYSEDFVGSVEFGTAFKNLVSNREVKNLYTFIDGLFCRVYQGDLTLPKSLLSDMIAVKQERNWDKVNIEYLDKLYRDNETGELIDLLKACDELVSNENISKVTITDYLSPGDFVKKIFMQNSAFNIPVSQTKYQKQQFVLTTTKAGYPDTFSMKYRLLDQDPEQLFDLPELHFAIERVEGSNSVLFPLSWCGKPTCDKTRAYWNWGYINFHDKKIRELDMDLGSGGLVDVRYSFKIKSQKINECRLVAFVIP